MILEKEILPIIDGIIEIRKKLKKDRESDKEYFDGYKKFVDWKEAISNHTVKGKKPVKLLSVKAPNQSEEELQYILANYKQITLPVSFEFLSTIGRGLHDSNWSIDYSEDASQFIDASMTFKQYLEQDIASTPLRMSYDSWMKFVLPTIKLNDSMGVVGFKPYRQEATVLVEGEEVIAGDTLPEPMPFYYGCERVLSNMDWGYLLVETNNYSVIEKGGKKVREGLVFELWDDQNIWTIEQIGVQSEWKFQPSLYFNHGSGFIPATYLQGIPVYNEDGSICYQSPFLLVSDILDEALIDGTVLRNTKASCGYPQKVMIGNECEFKDEYHNPCQGGYIIKNDNSGYYKCTDCHGTGMAQRTGPLNTLLIKGKTSLSEGDMMKPVDALAYISPSIEVPKFLREEITQAILSAMSILHLKTTNTVVRGAEDMTATGMVMDEKGKYAFIKSVVDQIFDIYEFGMKCMGMQRYGEDFKEPFINRPISYDFNTEGDYLNQIAAAQNAGAPPVTIASYVYKYLRAIFYDNPQTAKAYDLIIAADYLLTMTREEVNQLISRNLVERWEITLHNSALTIIHDLLRENPRFLDQDMQVMIDALIEKAKLKTPSVETAPGRLTAAQIIANANSTGTP